MDSYSQPPMFYSSPPSHPSHYANYQTPSTPYCYCCCPSTPYYHSQVSPTFSISPSPYIPLPIEISSPPVYTPPQPSSSSSKITRLQYTNKDRYILNELFKRTPYPNGIQRDLIARQLGISQDQIRIWFQNRRRLQTQRDSGERLATSSEMNALQQGRTRVNTNDLRQLLNDVAKYKDAPPRLRLDESS